MQCTQCHQENGPGATRCTRCGSPLAAAPPSQGPRTCPRGLHLMGAGWTECTYCKADQQHADAAAGRKPTVAEPPPLPAARRDTVVEPGHPSPPPNPAKPAPASPPAAEKSGPRKTEFYSASNQQPDTPSLPSLPARRIVGLLITYTWHPEGQVFPLREGRNLIGRDPSQCDIAIPEDQTLSSINSHITFRKTFVLGDSISMSGTDLDDDPVEEQFRPLPNYSRIRTGSTHWVFLMVDPHPAQ